MARRGADDEKVSLLMEDERRRSEVDEGHCDGGHDSQARLACRTLVCTMYMVHQLAYSERATGTWYHTLAVKFKLGVNMVFVF